MEKTITKTIHFTEENIMNLLANGLAEEMSFSYVDWDENDYREAKESLKQEGKTDLCREDVWARMLVQGKALMLFDAEDEDEHFDLTLDKIVDQDINWRRLEEDGDFYDNDAILQKAVFGKVIYG